MNSHQEAEAEHWVIDCIKVILISHPIFQREYQETHHDCHIDHESQELGVVNLLLVSVPETGQENTHECRGEERLVIHFTKNLH